MATLRDYIAYARTYIHPSLSDEAGQALVQAYVGQWLKTCSSPWRHQLALCHHRHAQGWE